MQYATIILNVTTSVSDPNFVWHDSDTAFSVKGYRFPGSSQIDGIKIFST
jgi:hypothetical protein